MWYSLKSKCDAWQLPGAQAKINLRRRSTQPHIVTLTASLMDILSAALSWCRHQVITQSAQHQAWETLHTPQQSTKPRQTLNTLPIELQERVVIEVQSTCSVPSLRFLNIYFEY